MTIEQVNDTRNGYFKAVENEKEIGRMTYVWAGPGKFIIDHTEVGSDFSGRGVGKQLVFEAVKYARDNRLKIMPLCSFAKSVFDKNTVIHDVLF